MNTFKLQSISEGPNHERLYTYSDGKQTVSFYMVGARAFTYKVVTNRVFRKETSHKLVDAWFKQMIGKTQGQWDEALKRVEI